MPLPSSGGTVLIEMLNMLEHFDFRPGRRHIDPSTSGRGDEARLCRPRPLSRRPRNRRGADSSDCCSKEYGDLLSTTIDLKRATPAADVAALAALPREGQNTTHYSVIDKQGNAVSNTYSLNFPYGIGLVAEGTGVLLNNTLDDFTAAVGASNFYRPGRLRGQPARTEQAAAVIDDADHRAEGRQAVARHRHAGRQPHHPTALQVIVNVVDYRMNVAAAVAALDCIISGCLTK